MSSFTQLYLTNNTAPYSPATFRGTWNDTSAAVTKLLETFKDLNGNITTVAKAEVSSTNPFDVLLYRGVSGPLAAQTISGTVNVMIGVLESLAAADMAYKVHIYVTQGDSDTPRGTLLSNYAETTSNEWSAGLPASAGKALSGAQTLSSLAISSGDRLVVEIGYRAANTVTTSYTGTLYYGTQLVGGTTAGGNAGDLTAGADSSLNAGFITFSNAITENNTATVRATQVTSEVLYSTAPTVRVTQVAMEVVHSTTNPVRVTQVVVEVLRSTTSVAGINSGILTDGIHGGKRSGVRTGSMM